MTVYPRPIRVCHVAPADGWAGAEVQLAVLLSLLSKRSDLEVSAVLLNEGRLAGTLRDAGISTCVIPESRHNPLSIAAQLAEHLKRDAIDLVHTHKWKDNVVAAIATIGGPVRWHVRTIHGSVEPFTWFKALKARGVRALDHVANRWAVDRIVTVSRDLTHEFAARFGVDKVAYIQNGIDLDHVHVTRRPGELRADLGLPPNAPVVGTMGRLVSVKALDVFLRAARVISDRRPDVTFVIAGSGPLEPTLLTLARNLDLQNVLFLGHRDDSYDVLRLMDVFVLPSLNEGIPMVLLEALALARPVVASRVGGIPDIVEHETSGLLSEPGNAHDVAQKCLSLLDDQERAQRLGMQGRSRIEERFSAGVMASTMADVYRTLVASEAGAGALAVRTGAAS